MNAEQKLDILADSSKYDLSCACKRADEPGRRRGVNGQWIYPAVLPDGRYVFLLKTLQSNACVNDCSYCPFNHQRDVRRCTISPDQLAGVFMSLHQARLVDGLFLSSGVVGSPDQTMDQMLSAVDILRRKHHFKGFIHLKVIPGSSPAAIEQAVRLATRVSVNIEAPSAKRLALLSRRKRFHEDIIQTMTLMRQARLQYKPNCHMTTQFVVGAAGESDHEIVLATHRLYEKMELERVYFSAYQTPTNKELPATLFPDEFVMGKAPREKSLSFIREHRLYQVDFLFRRYGFDLPEIPFDADGNLNLDKDPKQLWAEKNMHLFPVDINRADKWMLLRVPGIGPRSVKKILQARKETAIHSMEELKKLGIRAAAAAPYLKMAAQSHAGSIGGLFEKVSLL